MEGGACPEALLGDSTTIRGEGTDPLLGDNTADPPLGSTGDSAARAARAKASAGTRSYLAEAYASKDSRCPSNGIDPGGARLLGLEADVADRGDGAKLEHDSVRGETNSCTRGTVTGFNGKPCKCGTTTLPPC
mmetsp:Transcript_38433/g.68970  ORF Transcript_38433/g.68970 Transcript_38433/m.68970 type:complete len:133 (+) Transcript_38433:1216-1614(+)